MTVNEHLLGFVAMAGAILAILAIGTLFAADIIHLGSRRSASRPSATRPTQDALPGESDSGEAMSGAVARRRPSRSGSRAITASINH